MTLPSTFGIRNLPADAGKLKTAELGRRVFLHVEFDLSTTTKFDFSSG